MIAVANILESIKGEADDAMDNVPREARIQAEHLLKDAHAKARLA